MMLFNEPRNWKWMVPAAMFIVFLVCGLWLTGRSALAETPEQADTWMWESFVLFAFAFICVVATLTNWWIYLQSHLAEIYATIHAAQHSTAEVRLFEAAKSMHPDAVHDLLAHRRLLWRIKYVAVGELVDWVLNDAPSVHAGFVDFVLDYSSHVSLMPKSMLSEGSKQFDPDGVATDYEQYDSLLFLMQQKLMCTEAFGNQSAKWIAPWTPELVRHRFGLDDGIYQAEGSEMLTAVRRAHEAAASQLSDPLRTIKDKIQQDALEGLEQTKEMKRNYQMNIKKVN